MMLVRLKKVGLQLIQRSYSMKSAARVPKKSGRTQFDKSMLKPALVVIIFGSMLSHVSNQQKRHAELERRYGLKMEILNDLIGRAKNGDIDFEVDRELKLVNKLFSRHSDFKDFNLEEEADDARGTYDSQTYSKQDILESLNRSTGTQEPESLDDFLKSIIEEADDNLLIERDQNVRKQGQPHHTTLKSSSEGIVEDKQILRREAERESELEDYKPSTEVHLIVENPGELYKAAEETKVTKFL